MKWGGWTNPRLRRWMGAAVVLLFAGLAVQALSNRQWTLVALGLDIAAAVVLIVGTYRYQDPPRE